MQFKKSHNSGSFAKETCKIGLIGSPAFHQCCSLWSFLFAFPNTLQYFPAALG